MFASMLQKPREGAKFRRLAREETVNQIEESDDWVTFQGETLSSLKHGFKTALGIYEALQLRMRVACRRKDNLWR